MCQRLCVYVSVWVWGMLVGMSVSVGEPSVSESGTIIGFVCQFPCQLRWGGGELAQRG